MRRFSRGSNRRTSNDGRFHTAKLTVSTPENSAIFESIANINGISFIECLMKFVNMHEIFQLISLGFPHFSPLNQVEDNFAEIFCGGDSPVSKHDPSH